MADGKIVIETEIDSGGITQGLAGVQAKASAQGATTGKNIGSSIASGIGTAMKTVGVALAGATTAVAGFGVKAVKSGMQFDTAMSQVAATMGYTTEQLADSTSEQAKNFQQLRDFAQEMGSTTKFTATEASSALNYMALAGYDAETSMRQLPNVLNLASAGAMDLATASDMVTDAQTALGLTLEDTDIMVDQMAKTASKSNTSVSQLGEAILTIGATARDVKGGTQELSTVLGVLANNGIKGSEGGTKLRNAITKLTKPTDAGAKALTRLGVSLYDSEGKMKALPEVFLSLQTAMQGMTQEARNADLATIFNPRDLAAINALVGTSAEEWNTLSNEIGDCAGSASTMAEIQLDNLQGDVTILNSAFEGFQIAVSDALKDGIRPFVKEGSSMLAELTTALKDGGFDGLISKIGELLPKALDMVLAYLPKVLDVAVIVLESLITTIGNILPSVITKIISFLPQLMSTGAQMIMALVKGVSENVPVIVSAISSAFSSILLILPDLLNSILSAVISLISSIAREIPVLLPVVISTILQLVQTIVDNLPLILNAVLSLVSAVAQALPQAIVQIIKALPSLIKGICDFLVDAIPEVIHAFFELLTSFVSALPDIISAICSALPTIIESIVEALTNPASIMQLVFGFIKLFGAIVIAIPQIIVAILKAVPQIIVAIVKGLIDGIPQVGKASKQIGDEIVKFFKELPSRIWEWLVAVINKIATWSIHMGVKATQAGQNFVDKIKTFFINLPTNISNWIKGAIQKITTWAVNIKKSASEGLQKTIDWIKNNFERIPEIMWNALKGAITNVIEWGRQLFNKVHEIMGLVLQEIKSVGSGEKITFELDSILDESGVVKKSNTSLSTSKGGSKAGLPSSVQNMIDGTKEGIEEAVWDGVRLGTEQAKSSVDDLSEYTYEDMYEAVLNSSSDGFSSDSVSDSSSGMASDAGDEVEESVEEGLESAFESADVSNASASLADDVGTKIASDVDSKLSAIFAKYNIDELSELTGDRATDRVIKATNSYNKALQTYNDLLAESDKRRSPLEQAKYEEQVKEAKKQVKKKERDIIDADTMNVLDSIRVDLQSRNAQLGETVTTLNQIKSKQGIYAHMTDEYYNQLLSDYENEKKWLEQEIVNLDTKYKKNQGTMATRNVDYYYGTSNKAIWEDVKETLTEAQEKANALKEASDSASRDKLYDEVKESLDEASKRYLDMDVIGEQRHQEKLDSLEKTINDTLNSVLVELVMPASESQSLSVKRGSSVTGKTTITNNFYDTQTSPDAIYQKMNSTLTFGFAGG